MAIKILSVDDEQDLEILITQYFRRKIRKGEYEFFFAHNGLEALKVLLSNPDISIILSDINMPEMDGLTLLNRIREMHNPAQKCIMVSAYGDMQNIRRAMNDGAFDFATKPIDMDDLQLTIDKAIEQIEFVKKSQAEHRELTGLHSDLEAAAQIQQAIIPRHFPPFADLVDKIDIYAMMKPAKDVGGDFFDIFRIDDKHIAFTIADVSGKGIPAALFMAVSRTILRTKGLSSLNPIEVVEQANNMLAEDNERCMFVTVLYGILDLTTGVIDYVNAGHNPPYMLKADGSLTQLPVSKDIPVGVMEGFSYNHEQIQLSAGDTLVCYTDGITEATNAGNEEYGEARLEALLPPLVSASAEGICNEMFSSVKDFVQDAPQSDDITVLSLKIV
ncbi:MAG: fused response regulator/phosphatase [Bacteroidaceae bacterium]|nr:fused response regulator/phosphatase [Bacteroidaceae bacterium]